MGRQPSLTADDVRDIRESYFRKGTIETPTTLARLYHVSTAVIHKVIEGTYVVAPSSPTEGQVAKAICEALGDDWNREGPGGLHEAYGPAAAVAMTATRAAIESARMDPRHDHLNALMDTAHLSTDDQKTLASALRRSVQVIGDDIVGVQGDRDPEEPRLYLIVRGDIEMSIGKGMAQAGHAFVGVVEAARRAGHSGIEAYLSGQQGKIAMKAKNAHAIERAAKECRELGLPVCVVTDAGRTEFTEPTLTCMAVGPVARSGLPKFVQRMQLNS